MRTVDANALIKVKFNLPPYTHIVPVDLPKEQTEVYERGWNDAVDAIMECAEIAEPQQWIPISSGNLPENSLTLVLVQIGTKCPDVELAFYDYNRKCWENARYYQKIPDVVAWIPLPKPYKTQESEDKE